MKQKLKTAEIPGIADRMRDTASALHTMRLDHHDLTSEEDAALAFAVRSLDGGVTLAMTRYGERRRAAIGGHRDPD